MSDRGAPAVHEGRGHGERARRRVGVGECRGVHHDPRHQRRRQGAVAGVERHPEPDREQRGHLARRGGTGVDPVARPPGVVGGVVVDDHPRQIAEQLRVPAGDRADALGRRAVGQDQQVVGDGGIRIRADALDVGHEGVDRRRLVGEHRGRAPADGLDQAAQRERRAERVRVRVLVADGEHLARASQASHHLIGDRCGGERDEVDGLGHPRREPGLPDPGLPDPGLPPGLPWPDLPEPEAPLPGLVRRPFGGRLPVRADWAPRRCGGRFGASGTAASALRRIVGVALVGQAADRRRQRVRERLDRLRVGPGLELVEEVQKTRPPLGRVVEPDVELRDPPDPQPAAQLVADIAHRLLQRAQRLVAIGLAADHAHPYLGVPEIRRRLDVGDRREPDARVRELLGEQRPDLLAQELVDALGALAHGRECLSWRSGCVSGS